MWPQTALAKPRCRNALAVEACFVKCRARRINICCPPQVAGAHTASCWRGSMRTRCFGAVHRLTVDAYALQHPGDTNDRRAIQSVWVHYAALQLAFEHKRPLADIPPVMQKLAGGSFTPLPTIPERFAVTHADVIARPIDNHSALVRDWAHCAYDAWSDLNQPTKELLNRIGF